MSNNEKKKTNGLIFIWFDLLLVWFSIFGFDSCHKYMFLDLMLVGFLGKNGLLYVKIPYNMCLVV